MRRTRVIIVAVAATLLLALAAAHTAPVRALVLRRVTAAVRTSYGIDLRVGSFSYNVLALSAELRDVQMAAVDTPSEPFAAADALAVTFGARTLIGDITLRQVSLTAPRIDIRRHEDGTDNVPRVSNGPSRRNKLVLPPIVIDDLEASFRQPAMSVVIHGASVRLTSEDSGGVSAAIDARRGLQVTVADRAVDVETAAGVFAIEDRQLEIRHLTAAWPGTALRANGRVELGGEASSVDVSVTGSSEIESWWTKFSGEPGPAGGVEARARVTGLLSEPTIAFEADGRSLAWSDVRISTMRTAGGYRSGQLSLRTLTLGMAGGTVEGSGTITVDDTRRPSRIEAQWAGIDARQIPGAERLAGMLSPRGAAVVEWGREGPSASPRFEVRATTGVVASGTTTEIDVQGVGEADRWHVEVAPRDTSALGLRAAVDIRLDSRRWQASAVGGRVMMRPTDFPVAIRQAQAFGAAADIDPATAAGVIEIEATLGGTLAAVRSTGRLTGRSLTLAGLPPTNLDVSFAVDGAAKTSTGTFNLLSPELLSTTLASQSGVTLGGSLTASGSWSGPLSAPIVDASVTGRDLRAVRAGSPAVTGTGGTFDATVNGPIANLGGTGSVTFESLQVAGQDIGQIASDLTLNAGVVRALARAPEVKVTLDASVGLDGPNAFDGRATIADYEFQQLGEALGLGAADAGALRGTLSSSLSFKGDLRNPSSMAVNVDVAPIAAMVFEVPVGLEHGFRASLAGGRLQIEDGTMTIGGVAVRARGALAVDRPEGNLVLDLDGDIGTLQPWLRRVDATRELAAAGRLAGRVQAERFSTGLAVTGSLDAALSTLSSGTHTVARDVRLAIELTGQRAEVREVAAAMLGGRLQATGGVPLVWLNEWLPPDWQIAHAPADAPATLEGKASFDVPALLEVLGRTPIEALGGAIDLSAKLTASRPDVRAIAGDVRLERAEVTAKELTYAQSDVTRLRVADGALTVENLDWRAPGSKVNGRGSVGHAPGVKHDIRLDVDTDLAILGAVWSSRATGRLAGQVEFRGQSGAARLAADMSLSEAAWLLPGQRILFAGWSGRLRLTDDDLSVTNLGGTVNGGVIRIDGQLPLRAQGAGGGLTIAARDILLEVPRGLHSQLGADLVWRQSEAAATLQGKVEITSNRYTEPVTRILEFVDSLASATRSADESSLPPWLARTSLEIGVVVTDPILIDNSVGTVELIPDLRLGGTVESPALAGRIDVVDDGRVQLGGRAYRLRDSQLRFAPADRLAPTLDVLGETRIGDYDVTIRITGTPDRIETAFSSVPPLGERELQALIVTGRADERSVQSNESDNFAAAAAATDILGFAGKFVGLDSVRLGAADLDLVSKDVSTAQHLTVSKSLGSSFDLIFSDNLEDGSVTWVLVWKPIPLNEIRAASVEDGTRTLEFRRSLVFGPGMPGGAGGGRRSVAEPPRAIVNAVQITGTPGFTDAEVSDRLELGAGDRFDVRQWIEDRHRLEAFYLDRGYHRVRIVPSRIEDADRSHVSLTYDIARGPQTVIEVNGDPLPDDVLDEMYEAWRGLPIADLARAEFERIAREGLAKRGFYRPTVELELPPETPALARVTLRVGRGPRTSQLSVAWSGNRDVPAAELDALIAPHLAESAVWLDSQAIAWEVRQLYASRGRLQAQVTIGEPVFRDAEATLPIAIDEGTLSRLVDVRIDGVDPVRMTGAQDALGLSIGEPLAASAAVDAARRLKAFYMGLGYRNAAVTPKVTTGKDGSVSIAWAVTEGPLHVVKDVHVVGAETTNAGLVRDAITLEPGAAVSQSAVDTTRRNLYDIGSFRRVEFDFGDSVAQARGGGDLPVTLTIQTEEPQRFQLKYGVQFSFDRSAGTNSGTALGVSAELRDRNFIGRAVQASLGAHVDPDLQSLALLLSSPRFFGKRVRTNVFVRARREQDILDSGSSLDGGTLDDRRQELTIEQRWRPAPVFELVWGYTVASRRFLLEHNTQPFDASGLLTGPLFSVIVDRRDSPFDAKRGLFHSSSFQFGIEPFGSDIGLFRYLLRQSYYQPLGKLTAAGSVRYGTMQGFSGTSAISILDLLFDAGGTNSVRGYPEESLSAFNVAGFALGGTDLLVLNGELRFPIGKRFSSAAFVDAGNTFASPADIAFGRLAVGAGVGLRVRTPLAPLRLDVAYPVTSGFGSSSLRFHFSIGQMF